MIPDAVLLADLEQLGRLFALRLQLTVQPLGVDDLEAVGDLTLLPHFLIQGRIERSDWRMWLPGEIAVNETSLLLILHHEWGSFICSVTRGDRGTLSIRLERSVGNRRLARSDRGRYISRAIVPFLDDTHSTRIGEAGRGEVDSEDMRVEVHRDKFSERLSLVEKRFRAVDAAGFFSVLLERVEEPNRMSVSWKSSRECIERWVDLGYCRAARDLDPHLSYQSEAGTTEQDVLPGSVPRILDAMRGAWADKEVVVSAILLRRPGVRVMDAVGLFQMTHEPGGASPVESRVTISDELSDEEAEALKAVSVPVVRDLDR